MMKAGASLPDDAMMATTPAAQDAKLRNFPLDGLAGACYNN